MIGIVVPNRALTFRNRLSSCLFHGHQVLLCQLFLLFLELLLFLLRFHENLLFLLPSLFKGLLPNFLSCLSFYLVPHQFVFIRILVFHGLRQALHLFEGELSKFIVNDFFDFAYEFTRFFLSDFKTKFVVILIELMDFNFPFALFSLIVEVLCVKVDLDFKFVQQYLLLLANGH